MKKMEVAARKGHTDCLHLLIKAGADVNTRDNIALIDATHGGYLKCMNLLIKAGARVNLGTSKKTPLNVAAKQGHHKCLKLLLHAGARVDSSRYRSTPLSSAVKRSPGMCKTFDESRGCAMGNNSTVV